MSMIVRLLLSSCAPALLLACAARPELAQAKPPRGASALRSNFEFERDAESLRPAHSSPTNPYAPIRSQNAEHYFWQTDQRTACDSEVGAHAAEHEANAARALLAALPDRASVADLRGQTANPDRVVAALRPALRRCFSRWLDARSDAEGSVRFALELGCGGEVAAISAENKGVDEATLECLFSVVAPARFAPPAGGHASVLVPVVFKNAVRQRSRAVASAQPAL